MSLHPIPLIAFPLGFALFAMVPGQTSFGDWGVSKGGHWPESWPKPLEPLREQATTLQGGLLNITLYDIPFDDRDSFEAAWPQLLRVKTEGAPLVLKASPYASLGRIEAGVRIRCPPDHQRGADAQTEAAKKSRWDLTTTIELVVDGKIVDLNRIELLPDTPIVDQRFEGP